MTTATAKCPQLLSIDQIMARTGWSKRHVRNLLAEWEADGLQRIGQNHGLRYRESDIAERLEKMFHHA